MCKIFMKTRRAVRTSSPLLCPFIAGWTLESWPPVKSLQPRALLCPPHPFAKWFSRTILGAGFFVCHPAPRSGVVAEYRRHPLTGTGSIREAAEARKGAAGRRRPARGGAALYLVCMHLGIDQVLLWIRSGPMCAFCVGAYMRMAMRHGTVEFFFSAGLLIFSSVGHAPNGVAVNFCRLSIFQSGLKM